MRIDLHIHTQKCKQGDGSKRNITPEKFIEKMEALLVRKESLFKQVLVALTLVGLFFFFYMGEIVYLIMLDSIDSGDFV